MKIRGLLLPVYALPSNYGIGEFSSNALKLIDLLKENDFNAWQILPLNPVGDGGSPYQSSSSYAIEELYVSLDDLHSRGLIQKPICFNDSKTRVIYKDVRKIKKTYYLEAYYNYIEKYGDKKLKEFGEKNPKILEYAKFVSLKEINNNLSWDNWTIFDHNKLQFLVDYHLFLQMILFEEWNDIKIYANEKGISIIGDLPYYVGYDSSDVYFNQDLFLLENKKPTFVSGVGPDYFSKEGQLWGNPIYFYGKMYPDYDFIVNRLLEASSLYDIIRIDHFRAFDSYYVIKADEKTAVNAELWECPGYEILDKLFSKKNDIKLIAEDLGLLRDEVYILRDYYNLPGMNVIQFNIFEDIKSKKDTSNLISYLGTHDNMSTKSFISKLTIKQRFKIRKFFKNNNIKYISLFDSFVKYLFNNENGIISFIDLLRYDDKYRINVPSVVSDNNWSGKIKNFDKLEKMLKRVNKICIK